MMKIRELEFNYLRKFLFLYFIHYTNGSDILFWKGWGESRVFLVLILLTDLFTFLLSSLPNE